MTSTRTPYRHHRSTLGLAALISVASVLTFSLPAGAATDPADCDTSQPGTVGTVDHPTEPDAIVLRMAVGGGFVPFEVAFVEQNPTFTLYGSDVAIFQPSEPEQTSLTDPWPAFLCIRLSPEQVDELLAFALEEGGLADARDRYPHPNIVDVPATTFTIDAAGVDKVVVVEALGFEMAREQVAAVASVPNGGQVLIPIAAPDGAPLSLSIRPILPFTAPTSPAA